MHPNCTAWLVAAEFLHPQGRLCHLRPPGLSPSAAQPQAPHLPSLAYLPSCTTCPATTSTHPAGAAATADQATRSASNPLSPAYAPKVSPSSASSSLGHGCRYLYNKNVPLLLLTFARAGAHYLFDKMRTPCLASNCAWSTSRVPSL